MKVVARPGVIRSHKTGELVHVSLKDLRELYKVPKKATVELYNPRQNYPDDTVFLNPLPGGDYEAVVVELNHWRYK